MNRYYFSESCNATVYKFTNVLAKQNKYKDLLIVRNILTKKLLLWII